MEIIERLLAAADRGDLAAVAEALCEGADVDGRDPQGCTALQKACLGGHHAIVMLLLQHQASVAARTPSGETPLIIAARRDETEMAEALIATGAGLDDVDAEDWTPLLWAIGKGNLPLVRALVEAGADVVRQGKSVPLVGAIRCADLVSPVVCFVRGVPFAEAVAVRLAVATLLLDAGADPDGQQPSDGQSVLMVATAAGLDDLVDRLLAAGADVTRADKEGKTALDHLPPPHKSDPVRMEARLRAALTRTPGVAVERLEQGPPQEGPPPAQALPEPPRQTRVDDARELFAAVSRGDTERVGRWLAAGASVDPRNGGGQTPLVAAARGGKLEIALLLIDAGADVDASGANGETAMYWAAAREMPALTEAIRAAPGDALTRSRRLIEEASGGRSALGPNLQEEARAFADAARGGQDLDRHLIVLLHCYESLGTWRGPDIQWMLARPLVLHALRTGDRTLLARLALGGRLAPLAQEGLRIAFAFADSCGAELRPVYDVVVGLVAAAPGVEPLPEHLGWHPERLGELVELILQQAPRVLPRLMLKLTAEGWKGDASPGARGLVGLLRSSDDTVVVAAEQALAALARARSVDLERARGDLEELMLDGRHGFLAAALSVQAALAQEPIEWGALDRVCGHALEEARSGALQSLAWAWLRGQQAPQITTRLAAGLLDPAAPVRRRASEAIVEARRHAQPFSDVDQAMLARLVVALATPGEADAVADFLDEYTRSERHRAADVLALLSLAAALEGRAGELARIAREVVEERHSAPCSICRHLTADLRWGDGGPGEESREAPPEFRRLEPLPDQAYRCPECGTFYELKEKWEGWFNGESTTYWLEPRPAGEAQAVWERTQEYVRRNDLGGLDQVLLQGPDPAVRLKALATLEGHVEQGLDVSPLEPTLRRLLEEPSQTNAAARLLARHLLRRGRASEVESLLRSAALETRRGALDALWKAATGSWADVRACLAAVRPFLAEDDDGMRWNARAILATAGLQPTEAEATVADATPRLARGRAGRERAAAASLLADAARVADIDDALPLLAELIGDPNAVAAIARAAARGADIAALVPALVGRLRAHKDDTVVGILVGLQERGGDISPAFEVLASIGGSWPLEVLKRAGAKGDDLTPALAALHEVVEKANRLPEDRAACTSEGSEGETAAQTLASHYAFRGRSEDLERLVRGGCGRVRGGCARALLELAGEGPCDLTGAVPILREIAGSAEEPVRWAAEQALQRIAEGHPGRKR